MARHMHGLPMLRSRPVIALWVYLFYVSTLTLSPFNFSSEPDWGVSPTSFHDPDVVDIVLNIIGFSVFGIIIYWLWPAKDRFLFRFCVTVCCAGILSAIIEWLQVYLPARSAQLMDLLTNTIGGGVGFLLASYVHHNSWHLTLRRQKNNFAVIGISLYVTGGLILFMVTAMPRLDSWDRGYPLLIGNEATLDRAWLGNIWSLMIFDRALNEKEVRSMFSIDRQQQPGVARDYKPIVAYQFDEETGNTVYDRSQIGEPVNMQIRTLDQTAWLPGGGLRLQASTVLKSVNPVKRFVDESQILTHFRSRCGSSRLA